MTARRYRRWVFESVRGFADEQTRAGAVPAAEAHEVAEREFAKLLPHGPDTPGHHLWCAFDGSDEVGYLWLRLGPGPDVEGYVFDVAVLPAVQGRGYGRALMEAGEAEARRRGAVRMGLTVFGHNRVARGLYRSLGYAPALTRLGKRLDRAGAPPPDGGRSVRLEPMTAAELAAARAHERDAAGFAPPSAGPHDLAWTAYDGRRHVGTVRVHTVPRSDGRHASLRELTVRETLRGRGYGRAVGLAAEGRCRDRDVVGVEVDVHEPDPAATALGQRLGFAVVATRMSKALR